MKELVLVDPRLQRGRLFREALEVYRRRVALLRERTERTRVHSKEERTRAQELQETLNSVAARRASLSEDGEVRLQVFESGGPAMDYLRRLEREPRAVVFTDVYLEGSSRRALRGVDLVTSMRRDEQLRRIPTVLLCTGAPPERVREAWQSGSSAVVHLPMELPGMLVRVADAVEFWFRTAAI